MWWVIHNMLMPIADSGIVVTIATVALGLSAMAQKKVFWALGYFLILPTLYYFLPWWGRLGVLVLAIQTGVGSWFWGNGQKVFKEQVWPRTKKILGFASAKTKDALEKRKEAKASTADDTAEETADATADMPTPPTVRAILTEEELWQFPLK